MADVNLLEKPTTSEVLFSLDDLEQKDTKEAIIDLGEETSDDNGDTEVVLDEPSVEPSQEESISEEPQEKGEDKKFFSKKKKNLRSARIKELSYKTKLYESAAQGLMEENKALKRQLEQKEKAVHAYYEDSLKVRSDVAKQLYMQAVEEGDPEKQAEAQRYMIQYETDLRNQQSRKNQPNSYAYDENYDLMDYAGDVQPPSAAEEFLLENEWMDQHSPYYDPDKAQMAIDFEQSLIRELRKAGHSRREIEEFSKTREYFDHIAEYVDNEMGGNYGYKYQDKDIEEEEEDEAPYEKPQQKAVQRVAPVNRTNTSQTYNNTPPKGNTRVHLTKEDKEFALSLDYGYVLSDEEKIRRFAEARRSRLKNEQ
jgi:hypothetical protein